MKFCEKLVMLRKAHSFTQEQLAAEIGVSRQAVSRWESGETLPDISMLSIICNLFGVTADYLINDTVEREQDTPCIKKKDEEIRIIQEKRNMLLLISAVSFAVGAFFCLYGVCVSKNTIQFVIAFPSMIALTFLAVIQFYNYYKGTRQK